MNLQLFVRVRFLVEGGLDPATEVDFQTVHEVGIAILPNLLRLFCFSHLRSTQLALLVQGRGQALIYRLCVFSCRFLQLFRLLGIFLV